MAVAEAIAFMVVVFVLQTARSGTSVNVAVAYANDVIFVIIVSMAGCIGLLADAPLLRRKRGVLVEWSLMLGSRGVFIALPTYVLFQILKDLGR